VTKQSFHDKRVPKQSLGTRRKRGASWAARAGPRAEEAPAADNENTLPGPLAEILVGVQNSPGSGDFLFVATKLHNDLAPEIFQQRDAQSREFVTLQPGADIVLDLFDRSPFKRMRFEPQSDENHSRIHV
jgi:hypothetical protein